MLDYFTFWLIVLAILVAYLWFSIGKRRRTEDEIWQAQERDKYKRQARRVPAPGVAFDVSSIAPQIQQLRRDHLAALQARPHETFYRRALVAAVRQMVTDLSYFHRVRPEQEMPKPGASS
jgi:hypothetical protein